MNVVFVCQKGLLEIQSLLLAASIRQAMPQHELIAAVCESFGKIDPATRRLFNQLEVRMEPISNDYTPTYPVGNKMVAANVAPGLFLDSDNLCMHAFEGEPKGGHAITTGRYDIISNREWRNIHKLYDVPFKSNFNHVRAPFVIHETDFAKRWRDNSHKLWKAVHSGFALRRIRQVDQISLAITTQQTAGFKVHEWKTNPFMLSPSEIYQFVDGKLQTRSVCPPFLVLQKGWLYYKRQGQPEQESTNPNSLAYYPQIRSVVYSCLARFPELDRHPLWPLLHNLYFSHEPMDDDALKKIVCGVEGSMK